LLNFMVILNISRQCGRFYGQVVYFVIVWYIRLRFGIFSKKNLATLPCIAASVCTFIT
jgi:hypothetical protein